MKMAHSLPRSIIVPVILGAVTMITLLRGQRRSRTRGHALCACPPGDGFERPIPPLIRRIRFLFRKAF